ncbi:MAG TPA: energy-coupling factor transporter transmembrane component T [Solirubrobacteraceae bacterium]|jgi:energy-coupling factor transport system permease protein|nr:energy-coupling factor transporter transmembrane component T [Solirubrobacteraceae bacterium]
MSVRASTFVYRRLASPLHAARAGVGAIWAVALALAALASGSPIVLSLVLAAILAAGVFAGVGRQLGRSLRVAAIVAVPIVAVNVLVSREGLTVFARLGDLGPFGQGDLTVEALVYGATIALKVTILMGATTLASLAVDPDELLRGARRLSFRSALTASLATRMLPVLAGDGRRLAEAQRTRPEDGTGGVRARARLVSAVVASSLDRALDVAATLELRGFAHARRPPRQRRSWSRHDLAFAASAAALLALTIGARVAGLAPFHVYPEVHGGPAAVAAALGVGLALLALLPFVDRRGIEP